MKRLLLGLVLLLGISPAFARHHHTGVTKLPPLNMKVISQASSRRCIANAIWHEARSEHSHPINRFLVADAIISRSGLKAFSATPCGVVFQKNRVHHHFVHQFSWSGSPSKINDLVAYRQAMEVTNKRIAYFKQHPHRSPYLYFSTGNSSPGIKFTKVRTIGSFHWFVPKRSIM